jgi:hypothetical protein
MTSHDRFYDRPDEPDSPRFTSGRPDSDGLSDARRTGEELLSAGDEAIARALSGNSEQFLRANRQEGGQ